MEALVRYRKGAYFDDELTLHTELAEFGRVSLSFRYTILHDGEVLATGRTRHGCVELPSGRPSRIPKDVAARISEKRS